MLAKLSSKLRIVLTLAMVSYFKKDKSTKRYNDDQCFRASWSRDFTDQRGTL